jgi:hypothetical protein
MSEARAAQVVLEMAGDKVTVVDVRLVDGPPPVPRFDPGAAAGGHWLDILPSGGAPAHAVPIPPPCADGGPAARTSATVLVPWYGRGTAIIVRSPGPGGAARSGAPILLDPGGTRRRFRNLKEIRLQRWGHANPRAVPLVFLAEAFLAGQEADFLAIVEACLAAFEAEPALTPFLSKLQPVAAFVPSKQAGITPAARDTAFRARWQSDHQDERLILIDERRAASALRTVARRSRAPALMIVNEPRWGGSGGATAVVSAVAKEHPGILLHELGHTWFQLSDEYSGPQNEDTAAEPPRMPAQSFNVAASAERAALPWEDLLDPVTAPLPTDDSAAGLVRVGAYRGALHSSTRRFRPSFTCRMRDTGAAFCPVCADRIGATLRGLGN